MPHCLVSHVVLPPFPFEKEGYEFVYIAHKLHDLGQSLILTRYGGVEFFIRKRFRPKHKDYILKCEKLPMPTGIFKGAIRALSSFSQAHLLHHNLSHDTPRQTLQSPYQKSIWDFLEFERSFELEIGFGSGRHILQKAQKNPHQLFVGIEIHTPSIEQVLRQIELLGLENVWILNFDARIFLELIPSNLIEAIYVHFPVPWGKKPHRRVWSERFVAESLRVLKKGGKLELRSDDEDYFQDALKIALSQSSIELEIGKNLSQEVVSKYEARWRKQEKNIYDLRLKSLEFSPPKAQIPRFTFPKVQNLKKSFDTIPPKVVREDFFLNIESIYHHHSGYVLKLSLGDFNQPQSKFVVVDEERVGYISGDPLPTQASQKAHQALLKLLERRSEQRDYPCKKARVVL